MKKWFKRFYYSHCQVRFPRDKEEFDNFCSDIIDTFDLEDTEEHRNLIAAMVFSVDYKYISVVPKYFFDSIYRAQVNQMLFPRVEAFRKKEQEDKAREREAKMKEQESKMTLVKAEGEETTSLN